MKADAPVDFAERREVNIVKLERIRRGTRRAPVLLMLLLALVTACPPGAAWGTEAPSPPPPEEDGWGKLVVYGSCALSIAASVWRGNWVGLTQALIFCGTKLNEEQS